MNDSIKEMDENLEKLKGLLYEEVKISPEYLGNSKKDKKSAKWKHFIRNIRQKVKKLYSRK